MLENEAKGRHPLRPGRLLFALLATAAALATQTLAPAPAAAMVDEGEECADPVAVSIECETTGGGGGAESGGGTVGPEGAGGEIVGPVEVIEVEGAAPSLCATRPSLCLPSQLGGGTRLDRDGGRSSRAPRRRGRSVRPGELPIPPRVTPKDCQGLKDGRLVPPLEQRERRQRAELRVLWRRLSTQIKTQQALEEEERALRWELEGLRRFHPEDGAEAIRWDEWRLGEVWDSLESLKPQTAPYFALEKEISESPARAEREAFEKACEALRGS